MDPQAGEESIATTVSENAVELAEKGGAPVTDSDFEEVVRGALEAVGGTLLFKMRVDQSEEPYLAAAAFVGEGDGRQFLVLTMPIAGGRLHVETAARSTSPIAGIAAAYAGLADAFSTAA
ncbi:MAG: hypothetical protein WBA88_00655 [Pseudaminobacter sp.]